MGSGQLRRHRQQGSRRSFAYSLAAEYLPSAKLIAKSIGDEGMKDFCEMRQPRSSHLRERPRMGEPGIVMNSNVKDDCRLIRSLPGING
jgi:hypothetical protein